MRDIRPTPEAPSVVVKTTGVTLADKLKLSELPLATTPGGKVFAMKALHPSEHTIKTTKVPGGNKLSVPISCDMVQTFDITNADSVVDVYCTPNIVCPASVRILSSGGNVYGNYYNAAFGGQWVQNPSYVDTQNILNDMRGKIAEYRITSQSVTVELIAPALADQGTIAAAQYPMPPRTVQTSTLNSSAIFAIRPDLYVYGEPPLSSEFLLGSTAYTSKAKEGCYMPLKLDSFKWRSFADGCQMVNWLQANLDDVSANGNLVAFSATNALSFPYYEARSAVTSATELPRVPKMCGTGCGTVHVTGMAANVALRVRVRQTIEITVRPGTIYAPLVTPPVPADETSMKMYFEISSRMADAYPASYNDLGKLFNIVKSIGQKVLPFVDPALEMLSKAPGPIGTVARVATTAAPVVKGLVSAVRQSKASKKPRSA